MARADLSEAGFARDLGETPFLHRIFPRVDQRDRAGPDAVGAGGGEGGAGGIFVQRLDLGAVSADAAGDLDHALMQQRRQHDIEVE